ncbi:MerR family transcriptional regulator [Gammaproteobacteria bacterium]|nr:MerR family transcriptional regulator [Gammaproteobacteria bacterium]
MEIDLASLPDKKYFSMGEASNFLGVKDHILRYWEKAFKNFFSVERVSNRRMFQKSDLITFLKIKELSQKGLNVKAIKKILEEGDLSLELEVEITESLKEVLKILKT